MIKFINLVKRKQGISRPEFYKYWQETHGPFVARHIPLMRRYVQNHFIDVPGMDTDAEHDGIIEVWYDDIEAMEKSLAWGRTPEAKESGIMEDWAKIADMSPPTIWVAEGHVIKDEIG
ncbi:MAG: EthD domain-containing protein [Dehalococcoidales bacterium]|nr:EthD domain-containing protein [Dehalococcoidales bacterium]